MEVNPKFYSIPGEKQKKIINAAMKSFAAAPYVKVSLKDAAEEAGVSKSLLLYYFYSKEGIYRFIAGKAMETADEYMEKIVDSLNASQKVDIFDFIFESSKIKKETYFENLNAMNFLARAYVEENEDVRKFFDSGFLKREEMTRTLLTEKADRSKMRNTIKPGEAYKIIVYTLKGLLEGQIKNGINDFSLMLKEVDEVMDILKRMIYK